VQIVTAEDAPAHLLDDYLRLTDSALRRVSEPRNGLYIAESLTILDRALRSGATPRSVLTARKWLEPLAQVLSEFPDTTEVPVIVGGEDFLNELTGFHLHRGTLASMNRPTLPSVSDVLRPASRVVILEDIVDHTNVGALFRSVAGMGADGVIVTERCADPLYRRSIRVSMGTVFQVPWTRASSLSELVDTLHRDGWCVAGLALEDRAEDFDSFAASAPDKVALMLGSEGHGLGRKALQLCDVLLRIPMNNGVDSLNVAAAGAVALYGLRRARGQ
jgi:tRNA G18 (ribose-2'-O)-methylase SpoU